MSKWISTAVVGLICGICARFLLPGQDSMGLVMTMIVGIVGAYVGAAISSSLGKSTMGQPPSWVWSIVGAMVVLLGIRLL